MTPAIGEKFKVLVPEPLGEEGLAMLREAGDVELTVNSSITREELLSTLGEYDAIITRSGTTMDKEAIDAASNIKVIARAGVGVDNVNLPEASKRGIVVINAPTGNTLAAAEQTMALMLSLMRKTPQAHSSLAAGKWERKNFTGRQLNGKKLLIIGLGRIGIAVAQRCKAFGMEIVGYDPFISPKRAQTLGLTVTDDLAGSLSLVDVVSLHVPITKETRNLIDEKMLRAFKPGAFLVNCARGGVVDEIACAHAIRDGRLSGAAFDVFTQEPPAKDHPLLAKEIADRVVLTPHLGASTQEAQTEVARIAVTNLLAALRGEQYEHAVNLPFMEQHLNEIQKNYLRLARKMGILAAKLVDAERGAVQTCKIMLRGTQLCEEDDAGNAPHPYTIAFLKGLLEVTQGPDVNYMIAPLLAQERGISVEESTGEPKTYRNVIEVTVEAGKSTASLTGTITEEGRQHIVRINDYWIDVVPHGHLLLFQNHDRPGVIGKLGKMLGDENVNIASFSLGRKEASGLALAAMEIDSALSDELCGTIAKDADMLWATMVTLNGDSER